ncbi:MAG: hypothetical protein IT350_10810 [Deltaproteobacteria bacterium]|nr:hypothetical protein [Deltaproteobacteria bacterium]
MKRVNLGILLAVLAITATFFVLAHSWYPSADPASSTQTANRQAISSDDGELEESLGDGAIAYWQSSETRPLNDNGLSEAATLVIHGAADTDISATVRLSARIGPLNTDIFNDVVEVAAGSDVVIPVNVKSGLELHSKQLEYTTKLLGNVRAQHAETGAYHSQLLPVRFVAYNRDSRAYEVMDTETRDRLYPYGFTTPEGQEVVSRILARTPVGEIIDDIGPDIDPPVEDDVDPVNEPTLDGGAQ